MYKFAEKSSVKLCGRWIVFNKRHHYSRDIAATYPLQQQLEKSIDEVNDRRNCRLFNVPHAVESRGKYSSILPPPNVTGNLHLGHALMATVHDVICRWKLLNGFDVQWIPGLDHAGIATQVVVEKSLKAERNVTRHDIGKKIFLEEIWKWKEEKGYRIKDDLIRMGTIFNWEKEYFTMDENLSQTVVEAFIRLFEANLIYRSDAIINWSCSLESAISDIEVDNVEINGPTKVTVPGHSKPVTFGEIYEIAYRCIDDDTEIVVATTRPETILGDVAVAIHPNDDRYAHLRQSNTQLWHPFRNKPIPLIFDEFVKPDIGTGAVKITPAHNKEDFEVAKRHQLPVISVFDKRGIVASDFENYAGVPRFDARENILNDLAVQGLFRRKAEHNMQLPRCSRSHDVIEYFVKAQWFMRAHEMENAAIDAIEQGKLEIDPIRFDKEWKRWLNGHRDWCLSRQLWWGHRIPAYECSYNEQTIWVAAHSQEQAFQKAQTKFGIAETSAIQIKRDEDVFDTWFSAALLPFSVFGWPNENQSDSNKYYPLDIIVTGHDILFFWVARMVMLANQLTNQLPFQKILLHGIICDANGRKMSKSRGNVITPSQIINGSTFVELIDDLKKSHREGILSTKELKDSISEKRKSYPKGIPECGTDALRFTLCSNDIREHFINFDAKDCHINKTFCNKIWNATKFTLGNCDKFSVDPAKQPVLNYDSLTDFDRWILSRLANTLTHTRNAMDNFDFHLATKAWKRFLYENLCDVYLETTKINLWKDCESYARGHCEVLKTCLAIGLKQMGVFTPFLSNELLKHLPSAFEFAVDDWTNASLEADVSTMLEICTSIRQLKSENKIMKKTHLPRTHLFLTDDHLAEFLQKHNEILNLITFSTETIIHSYPIANYEKSEEFFLQSTAAQLCTFGITVDNRPNVVENDAITDARNHKKLENLFDTLQIHYKTVERFKKKDRDVTELQKKIEATETEIETLKTLMKS